MKIRDTFEEIKNTLKMEMGKIGIKNIDMPNFKTKTNNMKFESKTSIRKINSRIIPKIINFKSKGPIIKDLEMPEEYFECKSLALKSKFPEIEQVNLPKNDMDLYSTEFIDSCKNFSFEKFVFLYSFGKCDIKLRSAIFDRNVDKLKIKIRKSNKLSKTIRISRLKNPRSLPITKRPVEKNSVNFIYVFKGKEYLEKLGYAYSDLIFINYFDNLPMDLAVKIIVEESEIHLFYKRGIPRNIVDIALFKSKKTGKLLIAPIKRIKE